MRLVDTEHYTVKELFDGEHARFVIPDFQRDYCWGDKAYGEKGDTDIVSGFLQSLKSEYESALDEGFIYRSFIGKIDLYHYSGDEGTFYLTDGQQRITTLYLLLGTLYKYCPAQEVKNCLETANGEPLLEYAIRESSAFFLRDLVENYFYEPETAIGSLFKQPWFFNEYLLDPTVVSMVNALENTDKFVRGLKNNIPGFINFLINNVEVQYYDGGSRKDSEERFVIINTTGESLTEPENIKPLLLGCTEDPGYATQWEERETWFWKHRIKGEITADPGVNDFLTWCFRIWGLTEQPDLIKNAKAVLKKGKNEADERLNFINTCFSGLQKLLSAMKTSDIQQEFRFINNQKTVSDISGLRTLSDDQQFHILLPALAFLKKYDGEPDKLSLLFRRLRKNYYNKIRTERNNEHTDWRDIISIISISENPGEMLVSEKGGWYNAEERFKNGLRCTDPEFGTLIKKWEDHPDFMGYLTPLFDITGYSSQKEVIQLYFNAYVDFSEPETALVNEVALIKICSHFIPGWFGVDGSGYRCAELNVFARIFTKSWFGFIWKIFAENITDRVPNLRMINKRILAKILENKNFNDSMLDSLKVDGPVSITAAMITEFETDRVKDYGWADGYIVAAVWYWFYLEALYDPFQDLSVQPNQPQIGIQMRHTTGLPKDYMYSYANLKVVTHISRSWSVNEPYSLMSKVSSMLNSGSDITDVQALLNVLRKQLQE